jgi:hypothetical protein
MMCDIWIESKHTVLLYTAYSHVKKTGKVIWGALIHIKCPVKIMTLSPVDLLGTGENTSLLSHSGVSLNAVRKYVSTVPSDSIRHSKIA